MTFYADVGESEVTGEVDVQAILLATPCLVILHISAEAPAKRFHVLVEHLCVRQLHDNMGASFADIVVPAPIIIVVRQIFIISRIRVGVFLLLESV
jgi:hypothetical protein